MTPRARRDPKLVKVADYWRLRSTSTEPGVVRELTCALFETDFGLELRLEYSPEDLVRSQMVADDAGGRALAEAWRSALLETQGFSVTET